MSRIDTLHRRLGSKLAVSSLPSTVVKVQKVCRDPQAGLRDIALLIARDPPLAARTLRVSNSAYFGLKAQVATIDHAVAVLGMDAVQNLVVQVASGDVFEHLRGARPDFDARVLWKHAILTARIAHGMPARLRPGIEAEQLELAGLLHDIGQFVLLDLEREAWVDVYVRARTEDRPLRELEREVLGYDHVQVGALLARRWNLPELVGRCIELHHSIDDQAARAQPGVAAVIVADGLARAVATRRERPSADLEFLPPAFVSRLGFQTGEVQRLVELAVDARAHLTL